MRIDGLFLALFHGPLKHLYRLFSEPEYRRYCWLVTRYGGTPRYQETMVKIHASRFTVPDVESLLSAYKEIFVEGIYSFKPLNDAPVILDCGANIGLSILFFKKTYRDSTIIAYEADPKIYRMLDNNVRENGLNDVQVINKAVWDRETEIAFLREGSDAGRITSGRDANSISVSAVSLRSILEKNKFDFIKLDIEGAEVEALRDSYEHLRGVPYVFVEFHSFQNKKQELGSLIDNFERLGFRVHIHPPFIAKKPFLGIHAVNDMDMQLNMFFWKDPHEIS